jgi:NAD-dependent SIR2 family protein deacetylase
MDDSTKLTLQCFFCKSSSFVLPSENYQPKSGEQIQCANCGRTNDYDSLMRVAKRKAVEWGEELVQKELDKFTKTLGRMFR